MPGADGATRHETLEPSWRCPACGRGELRGRLPTLDCATCGVQYSASGGRPVLLDPGNPLFSATRYPPEGTPAASPPAWRRLVPEPSVNLSYEPMIRALGRLLPASGAHLLVVGSGRQRSGLERLLAAHGSVRVMALDVDPSADVDVYADALALPFADESFDAVVTTAVLEHVVDPHRAMDEIHRVLRPGGLLYSEVPFIQQVHEGAFDFTRYTLSGHRRLARRFEEIASGAVAGPATALVWALEHFAVSLAGGGRRRADVVRALVRASVSWLKHLDRRLARRPSGLDAASCTYFLGRKRAGEPLSDAALIASYEGAQGSPVS